MSNSNSVKRLKNISLIEQEGVIKYKCNQLKAKTHLPQKEINLVKELVEQRNFYTAEGMIGVEAGVGFGNISARYNDGFWISASQTGHLQELHPHQFCYISNYNIKENFVESLGPLPASSESLTHALLFEIDSSIQAVVHIHNGKLWKNSLQHFPTTAADVTYGTVEMANEVKKLFCQNAFDQNNYLVMAGHFGGLIFFGKSFGDIQKEYHQIKNKFS